MQRICKKNLLNEIKQKDMSKMKNLKYNKLQMQPYLRSNNISLQKKKILFKARTNMLNVKWNFGNKVLCPLCKLDDDTQEHLLVCILIKVRSPILMENKYQSKYSDIYSPNISKLHYDAELLLQATRTREIYLSEN